MNFLMFQVVFFFFHSFFLNRVKYDWEVISFFLSYFGGSHGLLRGINGINSKKQSDHIRTVFSCNPVLEMSSTLYHLASYLLYCLYEI